MTLTDPTPSTFPPIDKPASPKTPPVTFCPPGYAEGAAPQRSVGSRSLDPESLD